MREKIKKFFTHILANHAIWLLICIIILIVIIGTICFHFIEGWDIFNSFYFTSVTMSTIGYGDMAPVTYGGKIMAVIYGFMGAPLFIGLTGILFQSKIQKLVKNSIHAYHKEIQEANKEIQEAEKLSEVLKKENKVQKEAIEDIEENTVQIKKKRRKFW